MWQGVMVMGYCITEASGDFIWQRQRQAAEMHFFFFEPAAEMLIRTYLATAAAETLVVERRWANQSTGAVVIVRQGS